MMEYIQELLQQNQVFSAGAGLIGVGAGLAFMRSASKTGVMLLKRRYLTTLEIPSHDRSYDWFMQWMTQKQLGSRRHLSVRTSFMQHDNGSVSTHFTFLPGQGFHYFRYGGAWFQVERLRDKGSDALMSMAVSSGGLNTRPRESITLTGLTQNVDVLTEMLNDCRNHALELQEGKLVLYTAMGHEWRPFGSPKRRRSIDSVILKRGQSELIVNDVQDFLDPHRGGRWYIKRGIPYRRGYLLHGPAGSGKTSFIYALASHLEFNIATLNLAEKWMSDDRLAMLFASVPARTIVLLEDIDSAFLNRDSQAGNNLTFSGLLNALDGVSSSEEGRLIFMTTNHIERLDPALLRQGRIDVKLHVDDATIEQARRMFLKFYDDDDDNGEGKQLVDEFISKLKKSLGKVESSDENDILHGISMASLQGHFVIHKDDPQQAIIDIDNVFKQ
ncbi:hypothetical protein MP228_004617 [Amoeboaphelidium protococcarum]|nr:hypothetical protein MP228_004617 [Amoeboaphelidium protococcarum]